MKLFQKIAAITLAGIAALTFLTGCSQPEPRAAVDKTAEIVAVLNDSLHSYLVSNWEADDVKEYKSDTRMNADAQKAAAILTSKLSADETAVGLEGKELVGWLESQNVKEELQTSISDGQNAYYVFYIKNQAYTSGVFNSLKKLEVAKLLRNKENSVELDYSTDYIPEQDAVVLVGSAETKDGNYTAIVMKWPTQFVD